MNPEKGMTCPVCGHGNLFRESKREEFEYKGHKMTIDNYPLLVCNSCAEEFVSAEDTKLFEKDLTDFQREVDGLLKPDEIRAIRAKLGYNQTEFARLLRVGEKNFARYETGVSPQSQYLDWLMRILNQYPKAIRIIDSDPGTEKTYPFRA